MSHRNAMPDEINSLLRKINMYILRYTIGQFAEYIEPFDTFLAAVRFKRSLAQYALDSDLYFVGYIEAIEG